MLRVDGCIPYDTIKEMSEEELLDEWEAFVALVDAKNKAQREEIERSKSRR